VLFWLAVFGLLMFRVNEMPRTANILVMLCTAMLPMVEHLAVASAENLRDIIYPRPSEYETAATAFHAIGIQNGDRLAVVAPLSEIGLGFESYDVRAAGARIVAQVEDTEGFWQLEPTELDSLLKRLRALSVRAIVATNMPPGRTQANWHDVAPFGSSRLVALLVDQ